jgi:PAS domain S-box-containing protein
MCGIVFWQSSPTEKKEIAVVAVGFILWGIHKADYPFLQPVVWFAPWGYLLAAAIEVTVALGLLLVYFRRARNEMSESEEKFRSLAESSRDYIMRYDRQGRHTYMNPTALAIFGLTETDIIGKTHRECGFPEELCAIWEDKIMQVFATGEPYQMELSWKSIAGPIFLDWQLTPEHNAKGGVLSVMGVSRDITERKQLEDVQVFLAATSSGTERESFFYMLARFLAENLGMDFVCIDRLEGDGLSARTIAVWCDGHFEDNVSYALKDTLCGEVVGQQICCYPANVCKLFPNDPLLQELRAESYAGVTLLNHTGQPIGLIAIISRQPLENRRLAENTLKTVAVRAAGEMERLDAEHALRASENLLRDIAANIPGALFQFVRQQDGSFAIPYMSEGGSQLLGQPLQILQDVSRLFSNVHPDDIPGLWSSISESAEAMSKWRQEFRIFFPTGEICWLQGTSQPNRMDDGGICWNGFILDITERKQAEEEKRILTAQLQQAQKMEAIGTLAGGIAHDFNNILGAIVGYAEMIRDDFPPGSPSIHDINQVLKASYRAKDLVKQILAFSRQVEDQKIPVHPAVIVKEAITLLRSSLPTTITIAQDIEPDAGTVLADPTQFHQIVMNLCTNAFHAMEVKGGTLSIALQKKNLSRDDLTTQPDLQPGRFVQLSIKDTGEGIPLEIRERIFDPFFTTKEVGKGTGLGLSMVYSIVKSSGGSIICDSRIGEGTEFRIILPALEGQVM